MRRSPNSLSGVFVLDSDESLTFLGDTGSTALANSLA
jgi:hypothetical protein